MPESKAQDDVAAWLARLLPILLIVVVLALFLRTVNYEFTNYGDVEQVVENPLIRSIDADHLYRMFTRLVVARYYPVQLLSWAIDYHFWGLSPRGYHLTNVLIHLANVLLVYRLALRLMKRVDTRAVWVPPTFQGDSDSSLSVDRGGPLAGFAVAALFAVHPVVVEPVAWISGREDLLALFFMLSCVHLHVSALAEQSWSGRRALLHVLVAVSCAAACLSNAVAAVIPAIILAYDLTMARPDSVSPWSGWKSMGSGAVRILSSSWFLWALSAGAVYLKWVTDTIGAARGIRVEPPHLTLPDRVLTVVFTYGYNLRSLFWPRHLAVIYPNAVPQNILVKGVLGGFVLGLALLLLIWLARRQRTVQFGLLWFLVALAPASQVMPHHIFRADRFLYIPLVGLALAGGIGLFVYPRRPWVAKGLAAAWLIVIGALMARSGFQAAVWHNSVSLFEQCVVENRLDPAVRNNLGVALLQRGQAERAIPHFLKALRHSVSESSAGVTQINLAMAYTRLGRQDEAITGLTEVIKRLPNEPRGYNGRGYALVQKGDRQKAIQDFDRAIAIKPDYIEAYYNRGNAHSDLKAFDRAIEDYTQVITLQPNHPQAYIGRGTAYAAMGRLELAIQDFSTAISYYPNHVGAYFSRALIYADLDRNEEAIADYTRTLALRPTYTAAYVNRGNIYYTRLRDFDRAVADLTHAIALQPNESDHYFQRALAYAAKDDYDLAITDLDQAIRLKPSDAQAYFRRGVVYAQKGNQERAREDWIRAIQLAPDSEAARDARQNLQLMQKPPRRP